MLDHRAQLRHLADLEKRGVTRRAHPAFGSGQETGEGRSVTAAEKERVNVRRRRLIVLAPLVIFLGLVVLFLIQLFSGDPFADSFRAHRPAGAANGLPASRRPGIAMASRCRGSILRASRGR